MNDLISYLKHQSELISLEKKAQNERYGTQLNASSLKELKQVGVALHPLKVVHNYFGAGDQPFIDFAFLHPTSISQFRGGMSITCFLIDGGECNATLMDINDKGGTIRLHGDDFPDWIDERGLGVKIAPDNHTFDVMTHLLKKLELRENVNLKVHTQRLFEAKESYLGKTAIVQNESLNESQLKAVQTCVDLDGIFVLHGPPGTGKTTTLVHLVEELVRQNKRIVASAPSNAAVDHLTRELVKKGVNVVRFGNNVKISDDLLPYTPDWILERSDEFKQIKKLKKQADEYRKLAGQYKRNFGKEEREQRSLLYKEVKSIVHEIRSLRKFVLEKVKSSSAVITGTPVALYDELGPDYNADFAIVDEAGQCHDPLGWAVAQYASNLIVAGDPYQLPPTFLSEQINHKQIGTSFLDTIFANTSYIHLLETQYRMDEVICGFSNAYFYEGKLKSATDSSELPLLFFDTAGSGFEEEFDDSSTSRFNSGEIQSIEHFLATPEAQGINWTVITPYQGQIRKMNESDVLRSIKVSSVDSFQGQESEGVIISLVRSNSNQEIGFLSDYRRMNVALTRAKKRLVVIGDSSTIGTDTFFGKFLEYCELNNAYRSVFELVY